MITSLYSLSRRRRYRLVITEPEATNCFSINFQVFTNNNQLYKHYKNSLQIYYCIEKQKSKSHSHWSVTITSETANLDQSECRKINSHLEIYTKSIYTLLQTKFTIHANAIIDMHKMRTSVLSQKKLPQNGGFRNAFFPSPSQIQCRIFRTFIKKVETWFVVALYRYIFLDNRGWFPFSAIGWARGILGSIFWNMFSQTYLVIYLTKHISKKARQSYKSARSLNCSE